MADLRQDIAPAHYPCVTYSDEMRVTVSKDIAVVRKCLLFGASLGESHESALSAHGVEDMVQLLEMGFLEGLNVKWHG